MLHINQIRKLCLIPSSSSGRTAVKPQDRQHHRVTIADPQTDYYSTDDTFSDSKDDDGHLNYRSPLLVVHPMNRGAKHAGKQSPWHELWISPQ